jgi:hypothetical protein
MEILACGKEVISPTGRIIINRAGAKVLGAIGKHSALRPLPAQPKKLTSEINIVNMW